LTNNTSCMVPFFCFPLALYSATKFFYNGLQWLTPRTLQNL
jgi:hypothetical protein